MAGFIALLAALLAAAPPALAQPGGARQGAGRTDRVFAERPVPREPRGDWRSDLRADSRRDDTGPGRMSPEERQQLRRDIHEAGRDLYRRGPRRRD